MSRRIRFASMLVAVVLLAGGLVAFTPGDESEAKATLGPVQAVTLNAADFHPRSDNTDFVNDGYWLESNGKHWARIQFPAETVVITRVKGNAHDSSATGKLCLQLYLMSAGTGLFTGWPEDCTVGQSSDPQTLSMAGHRRVGGYWGAYLMVSFNEPKGPDLRLYGATVFYRVVT